MVLFHHDKEVCLQLPVLRGLALAILQWASAFSGSCASQCNCVYCPAEVRYTESDPEKLKI